MTTTNRSESVTVGKISWQRRLGRDPHQNGAMSSGCAGCPDVWELESGDFAIIGEDITGACRASLPPTASCGPEERIVRLPRETLILAKPDIPESV